MDLPHFPYHPDPIASGSIEKSDKECLCCGKARGYIYTAAIYCEADVEDGICPWCIADGSAHEKFDASFTDPACFPDGIAQAAIDEVCFRTPGFSSWQQGQWLCCCNDACAFLEPAGYKELQARYPRAEGDLITYIVHELGISGGAAHQLYRALDRDKGPTAYIFQCRHCDAQPAYIDML